MKTHAILVNHFLLRQNLILIKTTCGTSVDILKKMKIASMFRLF